MLAWALSAASSFSTWALEPSAFSCLAMSSPWSAPTSSSTPDWSSSSSAPAWACAAAILSWARCRAAPESLKVPEIPAIWSLTADEAWAALYCAFRVSFWVRNWLTRACSALQRLGHFLLLVH